MGGASEEYQGSLGPRQEELSKDEKVKVVDELFKRTGELYASECEEAGLDPPKNITHLPDAKEMVNPQYFAAYSYASMHTAWEVIGEKKAFTRFLERIGGRVFDAVSQYTQFAPNHNMDDIKGMRKTLKKFVDQYVKLGLAADAGLLLPKGMDKKWKEGEHVTFKVWVQSPVLKESTARILAEAGYCQDWLFFIVQKMFTSYLVDAEMSAEVPSPDHEGRIIQEWTIEPL